jgi:hypothetical protein
MISDFYFNQRVISKIGLPNVKLLIRQNLFEANRLLSLKILSFQDGLSIPFLKIIIGGSCADFGNYVALSSISYLRYFLSIWSLSSSSNTKLADIFTFEFQHLPELSIIIDEIPSVWV